MRHVSPSLQREGSLGPWTPKEQMGETEGQEPSLTRHSSSALPFFSCVAEASERKWVPVSSKRKTEAPCAMSRPSRDAHVARPATGS